MATDYIKRCEEILSEVLELKNKKNKDYNSGAVKRDMYFLHGVNTGIDEIYKKVLRLLSLSSSDQKPENESFKDTLIDIIGYTLDLYIYWEDKYGEHDKG